MNTDLLRKEFQKILEIEQAAQCFYECFIEQLNEGELKEQLTSICSDEIEHVKIAETLVGYISEST